MLNILAIWPIGQTKQLKSILSSCSKFIQNKTLRAHKKKKKTRKTKNGF